MENEGPVKLQEIPAFKEKIFKNKQLFYAPAQEKPGQKKAEFILLGISVGNRNLALIRDVVENKDYYCTIGDSIGAFRVKEILRDKVVLEADGNTMEITQ
jgi:type II secretory pathway component PulC